MKADIRYFSYGETEMQALTLRDPILGEAIRRIGFIRREVNPDLFEALVSSIVSQQISKKAYVTVWSRVREKTGPIRPENLLIMDREELKACGLSYKKTDWIRSIARAVTDGTLDLDTLPDLPDEDVIRELTRLPGIGQWTAQMLMIFSLQRPDILSFGDLAIRRGMMRLYGLTDLSAAQFQGIRQRLSPYNSVASLYFWELSRDDGPGAADGPIKY